MNNYISEKYESQPTANVLVFRNEKELLNKVRSAMQSAMRRTSAEDYLSKELIDRFLPTPLTRREFDILRLMNAGSSNKEMAESLFVSVNTIKTHISNLYVKLDVNSRIQAIIYLRELMILDTLKMAS